MVDPVGPMVQQTFTIRLHVYACYTKSSVFSKTQSTQSTQEYYCQHHWTVVRDRLLYHHISHNGKLGKGFSTEPWCSPTFTTKLLLSPARVTTMLTPLYSACTSHSSTPDFLMANLNNLVTSFGTISSAFSTSAKASYNLFFLASTICCIMNMTSLVPFLDINRNCTSSSCT